MTENAWDKFRSEEPVESAATEDGDPQWIIAAKDWISRNIPKKYQDARPTDFTTRPGASINGGWCIFGSTRTGKIRFAASMAVRRSQPQIPDTLGTYVQDNWVYGKKAFKWVNNAHLMSRFRSCFSTASKETEYQVVREMLGYRLLILDDFGAENSSDFSKSALYGIIGGRVDDEKETIITTNLTPKQIIAYEKRVGGRIAEMNCIEMNHREDK